MRGIICKVGCRFKHGTFIIKFKKGHLYSIVRYEDGGWCLVSHEEKKRVRLDWIGSGIYKYFIPYQPFKKKSRYERWKKS